MIKKLRNRPYVSKWEQAPKCAARGRKKCDNRTEHINVMMYIVTVLLQGVKFMDSETISVVLATAHVVSSTVLLQNENMSNVQTFSVWCESARELC
jgi:hypothetical protein